MDKVRLGFVGVGGMGQCAHLKNYVVLPDCEVVALAELRPELARQVANETGAKVVTDLCTHSLCEEAPTYLDMMRRNVDIIVEALR